jgi:cellobiose phosphorylase
MESVNSRLVRRDKGLVQLLDPAFDKSDMNPGYIKGYVPGVRENGGQYTHAAIWTVMAFAKLGDKKNAWEILSMINPVNHSRTAEEIAVYKVEPYVVAADVYSLPPHTGRGGWTWYTGSAGWMYRMIIESLLGLRIESDKLYLDPLLPDEWKSFRLDYMYLQTMYHITVMRKDENNNDTGVFIDGVPDKNRFIHLLDDGTEHHVNMVIS